MCFFFSFTRSLIDRCQIVTDTCKNNVTKFVRKPFKSPLSLRKLKCFGKAFLFNLHHPYFNYHLLVQKLFSLWKILQYLQPLIIRVLSERISLSLTKNICSLPAKGQSVWRKIGISVLKMLPEAVGHSFSPYGPPGRQITYMYIVRQKPMWSRGSVEEPIRAISEAKQTFQSARKSEQRLVLVLHLGHVFWPNHRGWWGKTVAI